MAKVFSEITTELREWIGQQHVFFVATAPLAGNGHINCSPKGGDSFRVLASREVVYQDYTGSGAETVAHLRENGRIVIMFCAFAGPPRIVRLHGRGTVITMADSRFEEMAGIFPPHVGTRAFIHLETDRIADSCGYAVPFYDFREHRDVLDKSAEKKGPEKLAEYRAENNVRSIDGLPALTDLYRE